MRQTRRNVLKTGAGLAATGGLAGLAGCSQIPVVGDVLGPGAFYQDQLHAPGTVSDRDHYRFSAFRPTEMQDLGDEFDGDTIDQFETLVEDQLFDHHGLAIADVDTLTTVDAGNITIVTGTYSTDDVRSNLEDADYDSERETDSGHEILLNPSQPSCVAVGDGSIVTIHSASALTATDPIQVGGTESTSEEGVSIEIDRDVEDLRAIEFGETVRSRIDADDPEGENGLYEPVTFQGEAGDRVDISMLSDPGDPLLFLENPAGDVVAQNDDYEGRGFNSRIQHELESSGEYRIIATGVRQEKTFPYVLSLGGKAVTQDLRSISYGQTETGAIDEEDPRNDLGFHEPVTFEGSEGDVVSIRMSGAEDAYLRLVDPSGRTVTESVSEINRQRLGSSGEYTIVATSEQQDRTFIYDLELELAFNPDQLVTAVEDVLRTQNGETERYVTAMEAANDLVTAIGGGTIVSGVTTDPIRGDDPENDRIRGTVGHGYAVQVAEGDSEYTAAAVFASQRDVRTRDVRDWVDAHSTLGDAREFEEAEQGRVGLVTGTVPTRSL